MNKKIVTVLGARPQFIKAASVSRALSGLDGICEVLVHTGQHYDTQMSAVFFRELEIAEPAYNLEVGSGSHGTQTGEMMIRLEKVLQREKPAIVLIYGDTNSTLAGALTAVKLLIPVVHVEAGLRSFNTRMPEEINRVVADRLSSMLFCPTSTAVANLKKEGISGKVYQTGDVMYDVALWAAGKLENSRSILDQTGLKPRAYILATIHRQENTDDEHRLFGIFSALKKISEAMSVVLPLHPRTEKMLRKFGMIELTKTIKIVPPVGFFEMVELERNAVLILTDSGGVQKEAYFHRVPCVTLREETEWVETVDAGWNRLADPGSKETIVRGVTSMIQFMGERREIAEYGNGTASVEIARLIDGFLSP